MRISVRPHFHFLTTISTIVFVAALDSVVTMTPVSALNVSTPASIGIKVGNQTDPSRTQGFWDYCQ